MLSGDLNVVLGLYDGSSYIKSATDTITIGSSADSTTLTLTFDNAVTWTDNMKIVAGVTVGKALAGVNNTDKYTLNGMSLSADVKAVPEPATATLSLLALAGLAARRRRH